jgi:hypothetical protein
MHFDEYWAGLVERVHRGGVQLHGDEAMVWRLSGIRGDQYVGGFAAFFGERWREFDADMDALSEADFDDVAAAYREVRRILFGKAELDDDVVTEGLDRWNDEQIPAEESERVDQLYELVGQRLDALEDYRDELGVRAGLFEPNR